MLNNNLEIWVRGSSRSLKLVTLERLSAASYSLSMAISCIICEFIASYWSKLQNFYTHLYLATPQGVTPSRRNFVKLLILKNYSVADGPSGSKTKKYSQDNIEKTSWELANVRLVPCLKNTNRDDFINFMYSQELYITIYNYILNHLTVQLFKTKLYTNKPHVKHVRIPCDITSRLTSQTKRRPGTGITPVTCFANCEPQRGVNQYSR